MLRTLLVALSCLAVAAAGAEEPPDGPLNEVEKQLLGKWRGERGQYRWEIERKEDRSFEIVFVEPDPGSIIGGLKNYAVGVWWVEKGDYYYEWKRWWGDEGDMGGVASEKIDSVAEDRVVTLSEVEEGADEDPRNVEVKVDAFKLRAWKLKPDKPAAADGGRQEAVESEE